MARELGEDSGAFRSQVVIGRISLGKEKGTFGTNPAHQNSRIGSLDDIESRQIVIPRFLVLQAVPQVEIRPGKLESFAMSFPKGLMWNFENEYKFRHTQEKQNKTCLFKEKRDLGDGAVANTVERFHRRVRKIGLEEVRPVLSQETDGACNDDVVATVFYSISREDLYASGIGIGSAGLPKYSLYGRVALENRVRERLKQLADDANKSTFDKLAVVARTFLVLIPCFDRKLIQAMTRVINELVVLVPFEKTF